MEKENLQHVQLPNRQEEETITPQEQLIYVSIRRFMNAQTKEAFPSLATIAEKSGASVPTIRKCIKHLESAGYFKIEKRGRQNIYIFDELKAFEPFSYEFLDNKNLSFLEKAYLVASQQFMYTAQGEGSISFTNRDLSKKINLSEATISRCNHSLESKGYLAIIENENREVETGCKTQTKLFHLNKFGQAVVFLLKNHEDRITNSENAVEQLQKENAQIRQENAQMKKTQELLIREVEKLKAANKPNLVL